VEVKQAQKEVRTAFAGGFLGQLVSGILWLSSAAIGTWSSPGFAVLCAIFVYSGVLLGLYLQGSFSAGACLTGAVLLIFSVLGWALTRNEQSTD